MSNQVLNYQSSLKLSYWLKVRFEDQPAAVAAALSEVRYSTQFAGFVHQVIKDTGIRNMAQAIYHWAIRRGEQWVSFDRERLAA